MNASYCDITNLESNVGVIFSLNIFLNFGKKRIFWKFQLSRKYLSKLSFLNIYLKIIYKLLLLTEAFKMYEGT